MDPVRHDQGGERDAAEDYSGGYQYFIIDFLMRRFHIYPLKWQIKIIKNELDYLLVSDILMLVYTELVICLFGLSFQDEIIIEDEVKS